LKRLWRKLSMSGRLRKIALSLLRTKHHNEP
jgi:hypothetical protein